MRKKYWMDRWIKAAACGFILAALLSFTGFSGRCDALERSVLRLHILADSDAPEAQAVKLEVRDAVLQEANTWLDREADFDTALAAVCTHLDRLETVANRVLEAEGAAYRAKAEVCDVYFPTRVYETHKLPAGKYRTLRISLGKAEGKNWWCVVFPSLCVSGAADFTDLPEDAREAVAQADRMQVRFMAVEIFNSLREFFDA
ncbi:MAG: stage II sporulation protein R [Clostridia bacterium]|nr:stage II sporulation protein R [Clostridia bacterium]